MNYTTLLRLFACLSILIPTMLSAQITVSGGASISTLVQDKLVGQGVTVSNISPGGVSGSVAFFNGVNSNIGLDSGIVMATGGYGQVPPTGSGNNYTGSCADADLALALSTIGMSSSSALNNCVIIEFDFVPTTDSIQFQYVFASDEYPGFTCSSFNDIFGFFLSGPGIVGPYTNNAKNIALIPQTNTPVAINTINSGVPSGGNPAMCLAANPNFVAHSIYFVNNSSQTTVGYPGFTVPLTAFSQVQCGQTYHIKLAIADVSDGALNSAVFLKANSFTSGQVQISSQVHFGGNDSTLYETCGDATLYFTRSGNLMNPDTVLINVTGTATNGVDYSYIPDTIIFQPGQTSYALNILAFADGLNEGAEILHLDATINNPCLIGIPSEFEISITDLPAVNVFAPPDTTICPGDTILLLATGSGGMNNHPLVYTWDNNLQSPARYVSPPITTSYVVSATDSCGIKFDSDTVVVTVMPPIYPSAGIDQDMCIGDSVYMFASGSTLYSWSPSAGLSDTSIFNPVATPTVTTEYVVTVSDGVCYTQDTVTVTVNPLPVITATAADPVICLTGSTILTAQGGTTYSWAPTNALSNTIGSSVITSPTTTTTYFVNGIDANGCKDSTFVTITVNPPLYIQAYGDTSVCAETLTDSLYAFATGGNGGPYTFTWSPSSTLSSSTGSHVQATPTVSTVYTVTVTDNCGTPSASDTVYINVFEKPEIIVEISDTAHCAPLVAAFTNLTADASRCVWNFGNGKESGDCDPTYTYSNAGNYSASLIVENSAGCIDTLSDINISVWPNPIADFTVSPPTATILNSKLFFKDQSRVNIQRWHWTIGDNEHLDTVPSFYYTFLNAGDYPVTLFVENEYGCTDEITYNVSILNDFSIYIPSAFSPNDDGRNDRFSAEGAEVTYFHMQIYDRWGMKVYETFDINRGWDGTFKGIKSPQDAYVYIIEAEGGYEGSRVLREGVVNLIR